MFIGQNMCRATGLELSYYPELKFIARAWGEVNLLRQAGDEEAPVEEPEIEVQEDEGGGRRLLCSICKQPVTSRGERREIAGKLNHVCANPHGFVFEIGCFARAWGCRGVGPYTSEYSWFPGYAWQILQCSQCSSHLGWSFTPVQAEGAGFFGLILDRLVEEQD